MATSAAAEVRANSGTTAPSANSKLHDSDHTEFSQDEEETVPEDFLCPLTLTLLKDPVVSRYGQSYEREAIFQWLSEHDVCPMTRQALRISDLISNHRLRMLIENWCAENHVDVEDIDTDSRNNIFAFRIDDTTDRPRDDPPFIVEYNPNSPLHQHAAAVMPHRSGHRRRHQRNRRHRFFRGLRNAISA